MEAATSFTFLLLLLLLLLLFLLSRREGETPAPPPPGPTPLPLVGNLLQINPTRTVQSLIKLSRTYGPVFRVFLGSRPVLVLGGSAIREALVDHAEAFEGRGRLPTVEETFRGHGVVFSNGPRWRILRRFSLWVLRDFGMGRRSLERRIQEEAEFLVLEFRKSRGEPLDPTFLLSCAVSNIISTIVFGNRFDYRDREFLELLRLMNDSFREMSTRWAQLYDTAESLLRPLPGPHRRVTRFLGQMREFIARRVRENARSLRPEQPRDFIDCFLIQMEKEKSNPSTEFTLENLELTALNLFFAGTETVSSTLRCAFRLLCKHRGVQERVFEELQRVTGGGRVPTLADRPLLPFTDAVIHEVQRCADLLPMDLPHRLTRDVIFRGYFVPKDTEVFPLLSTLLHDPSFFKHPDTFHPENFLDSSGRFQRNEAFLPFSAGKRLCLGESLARAELFLFFTSIVQNFQLQPLGPPHDPPDTPMESGFANIPPRFQLRMLER